MENYSSEKILEMIQKTIIEWHKENENRNEADFIVTNKIRPLNVHREDIMPVIHELVVTNTEIWHEEDKVRSENDNEVLHAIRNINPLNQHRNDLIEEIDEIVADGQKKGAV